MHDDQKKHLHRNLSLLSAAIIAFGIIYLVVAWYMNSYKTCLVVSYDVGGPANKYNFLLSPVGLSLALAMGSIALVHWKLVKKWGGDPAKRVGAVGISFFTIFIGSILLEDVVVCINAQSDLNTIFAVHRLPVIKKSTKAPEYVWGPARNYLFAPRSPEYGSGPEILNPHMVPVDPDVYEKTKRNDMIDIGFGRVAEAEYVIYLNQPQVAYLKSRMPRALFRDFASEKLEGKKKDSLKERETLRGLFVKPPTNEQLDKMFNLKTP